MNTALSSSPGCREMVGWRVSLEVEEQSGDCQSPPSVEDLPKALVAEGGTEERPDL